MTPVVEVRLLGGLEELGPPTRRARPISVTIAPGTSVKDLVESLGIPHTEIGSVVLDGRPAILDELLRGGERLSVYPVNPDAGLRASERRAGDERPRFALDVHLGRLARYLRLLGYDCWWRRDVSDEDLIAVALAEGRIILTRDRGLLKRRVVAEGYLVRETTRRRQVDEVLRRFNLFGTIQPFGRCLECNGELQRVTKAAVLDRLPPRTRLDYEDFERCPGCGRIYWQGSHYDRLRAVVEEIRATAPPDPFQLREAAIEAAGRAWSVVPLHGVSFGRCTCRDPDCPAPGKHPRIPWEHLMHERATATEVKRWWQRWPQANLGLVTGELSGLVILDVDPRNGGTASLVAFEEAYGALPPTVESETGGGGRHLYFRHPNRWIQSHPLAPGLDVKADGGLVVAPPSVHASGRTYRWTLGRAPEDLPLASLPPWLVLATEHFRPSDLVHDRAHEVPPRTATERHEFADLFAQLGIELRPGDHTYLCPFHPDHHPSLHVDADGCRFYCFGCGCGGGIGRLRHLLSAPATAPPTRIHAPSAGERITMEGTLQVEVVGTSRYQDELLELAGGRRHYGGARVETVARLLPDLVEGQPAVIVTIAGWRVGHLSDVDATAYREAITAVIEREGMASCEATVVGGWERAHGDIGYFGVRLKLPDLFVPGLWFC
jgi:uncharacterized protein